MSELVINNECNIMIYGAGLIGNKFYEHLGSIGLKVSKFLDLRYDKLNNKLPIPVINPESINKEQFNCNNTVIVISLANVFEHKKLARELNKKGFKYIVYLDIENSNEDSKKVNLIYNDLNNEKDINYYKVPEFQISNKRISYDYRKISGIEGSGNITVNVPVELIFTNKVIDERLNKSFYDKFFDKSILMLTPYLFLFNAFAGKEGYDIDSYIDFYIKTHSIGSEIDHKQGLKHVMDRYVVYENMRFLLNNDIDFFYNNPVIVKWNENGYFNTLDGSHRTTFLITNNYNVVPCIMSMDDFEKWINMGVFKEVDQYLQKHNLEVIRNQILHPSYLSIMQRGRDYKFQVIKSLTEFISKLNNFNLNVLGVGVNNMYISHHFARMKHNTTIMVEDDIIKNIILKINSLYYLNKSKVITQKEYIKDKFHIMSISLVHNKEYKSISFFKSINEDIKNFIIIEHTLEDEIFIDKLNSETEFTHKYTINTIFVEDKVIKVTIISKILLL